MKFTRSITLLGAGLLLGMAGWAQAWITAPTNIPGCVVWLDGADISSIAQTGGVVDQWNDKSGNGSHVTSTGTARPQTGVKTQNGQNVITFDGIDDYLQNTVMAALPSPYAIFVVARMGGNGGAASEALVSGRGTRSLLYKTYLVNPPDLRMYAGSDNATEFAPAYATMFQLLGCQVLATSTTGRVYFNRRVVSVVTGTNALGTAAGYMVGRDNEGSGPVNGDIAEVVVYNRELSEAELYDLRWYLQAKWNLFGDLSGTAGPGGIGTRDGSSDLEIWMRAGRDKGISSGTGIGCWYDGSGNTGRDAKQTTSANRPIYTNAVSALNNRASAEFPNDGVARYFAGPTNETVPYNWDGTNITVFVVLNAVAMGAYHNVFDGPVTAAPMLWIDSANRYEWNAARVSGGSVGNWDIVAAISRGTAPLHALYENGSSVGTPGGAAFTAKGNPWGASLFNRSGSATFRGECAEMIFFNKALNSAEQTIVENSLSSRYGITIANDRYAGDTSGNGDYDDDVFGIGRVDAANTLGANTDAGLQIEAVNGTLDVDGEWILAGHKTPTNDIVSDRLSQIPVTRWQRVWYVDATGSVDVKMTFRLADSGLSPANTTFNPNIRYGVLYSPGTNLNFVAVATGPGTGTGTLDFTIPAASLQDGYYTLGQGIAASGTIITIW